MNGWNYLKDSCLHLRLVLRYPLVLLGLSWVTPEMSLVPPVTVYWSSCRRAMHLST